MHQEAHLINSTKLSNSAIPLEGQPAMFCFCNSKWNFRNINSIKSFLIFLAGSFFSRFLRIVTVIWTRAFWYFQPSHYVFFAVITRFATSQFEWKLSDCIPPASSFLFLVVVPKTFATWILANILIQWVLCFRSSNKACNIYWQPQKITYQSGMLSWFIKINENINWSQKHTRNKGYQSDVLSWFITKNIHDMKDISQNSQISDNRQTCQVNNRIEG